MKPSSMRMIIGISMLLMTSKEALADYTCVCCCRKTDINEECAVPNPQITGNWGDGCGFACSEYCIEHNYAMGSFLTSTNPNDMQNLLKKAPRAK